MVDVLAIYSLPWGKPRIDLTLEVAFLRRQGTQWIVRHQFDDFIFEIRYTLPADELQNKIVDDETTLSARFPHVAAKGSWLNDAEDPDDRDDYGALEPG